MPSVEQRSGATVATQGLASLARWWAESQVGSTASMQPIARPKTLSIARREPFLRFQFPQVKGDLIAAEPLPDGPDLNARPLVENYLLRSVQPSGYEPPRRAIVRAPSLSQQMYFVSAMSVMSEMAAAFANSRSA